MFVRWLAILAVTLILLSVVKDLLIKATIEITAPQIIGAKVDMGSFSLGLLTHKIHITNFRLYNPPGFPNQVFLVMPEMTLQVDIGELMRGEMHFPLVVLNMEKMVVFKNEEGKLNVDSLKIIEEQIKASKGKPMKLPVFKIDVLKLNLGKVIFEDGSHAPVPFVQAYDVAIKDKTIKNINGLPKLITIMIVEALKPTAIRSAGLFAATSLMGVAFLPALAVGVVVANDESKAQLNHSSQRVYQESLKLIKELNGNIKKTEEKQGKIFAKVYGCDISIEIQDKGWGKSAILIKARKYLLAKPEIAAGLLYQLTQRLNKNIL